MSFSLSTALTDFLLKLLAFHILYIYMLLCNIIFNQIDFRRKQENNTTQQI